MCLNLKFLYTLVFDEKNLATCTLLVLEFTQLSGLMDFSGPKFGSTKVHKFFGSTKVHETPIFQPNLSAQAQKVRIFEKKALSECPSVAVVLKPKFNLKRKFALDEWSEKSNLHKFIVSQFFRFQNNQMWPYGTCFSTFPFSTLENQCEIEDKA